MPERTTVATAAGLPGRVTVATAVGMRALGARLAKVLRAGDLVLLTGPLGAGKTTLVQGVAEALRVRGRVTSPTFVIARVHPSLAGGPGLVHVDAYRLGGLAEMEDLDLDLDGSVTVVEWGEGLAEGLSADRLEIAISFAERGGAAAGSAAGEGGAVGREPDRGGPGPAGAERDEAESDEPEPEEGDEPRTVRIRRVGPRWAAPREDPDPGVGRGPADRGPR